MNALECIQSTKAYYEAKAKRRGSSDTEWIQSEPPPKLPFSQDKKPTQYQEDKEQAEKRHRHEEKDREQWSRMYSVKESLLRSRHSVGIETDAASGRERVSTRQRERETERQTERKERERRMNTEECIQSKSLLQSRHSFGRETDTASGRERASKQKRER
jgi:hypothetical protein